MRRHALALVMCPYPWLAIVVYTLVLIYRNLEPWGD